MGKLGNVLVTGSSRGIGLAIVRNLAKNNSPNHIIATCRNPAEATVSLIIRKNFGKKKKFYGLL